MNNQTIIQVSRSFKVEDDRATAVLRLDQHYFYPGEPSIVRYYSDEAKTKTDTLIAMGIAEGEGKDCYKVMSLGGLELVRDVVYDLPDVSQLVHGELYLYCDPEGIWNYVYEVGGDRVIESINASETIFYSINDKYRWFWDGSKILKREDSYFDASEINKNFQEFYDEVDAKIKAIEDKLALDVEELKNIAKPPVLYAKSDKGYLFKSGDIVDLPFSVEVLNYDGENITSECEIKVNGEVIEVDAEGKWTVSAQEVSADYKFEGTYTVNEKVFTLEPIILKVKFGFDFYYGRVSADWVVSAENVLALENTTLSARQNLKWTGINLNDQKTVFAYPKAYDFLKHIYDEHGICYLPDYIINVVDMGPGQGEYYVYVKKDPVTIYDFIQYFCFAEEDTSNEIRFGKYDEIIDAWNHQNMMNGLLVLGEDGKIPETLFPASEKQGAYIELVDFVTEYPQLNIIPGQLWYNSLTGKIFRGTTPETGVVEEPLSDRIYIRMTDKTMYVWKSPEMVSVGGSVLATKINDVKEILL